MYRNLEGGLPGGEYDDQPLYEQCPDEMLMQNQHYRGGGEQIYHHQ